MDRGGRFFRTWGRIRGVLGLGNEDCDFMSGLFMSFCLFFWGRGLWAVAVQITAGLAKWIK